jgi:hypothetical protein
LEGLLTCLDREVGLEPVLRALHQRQSEGLPS